MQIVRRLRAEEPDLDLKSVEDLKAIPPGGYGRRGLHDDITIIVLIYDTPENAPRGSSGSSLPPIGKESS